MAEDDSDPFSEEAQFEAEIEIRFLTQIIQERLPIDPAEADAIVARHHRFRQLMELYIELFSIDGLRRREILGKQDCALKRFMTTMNGIDRERAGKRDDPEHRRQCDHRQLAAARRYYEQLLKMEEHRRIGAELWDPDVKGRRL